MKGHKPFATRLKVSFAAVAAVFGLGLTTGGIESLPKDPATDTQSVTTFQQDTTDVYGYNISPADQFWKATLSMKTPYDLEQLAIAAAEDGDVWRTKALLEKGLEVYTAGAHEAFAIAAYYGHDDVFNAYLDAGIDPGANDGAALLQALRGGNADLAYVLLAKGVSGASQSSAVLTIAAMHGDVAMVEALLKAGADATAENSAALHSAVLMGHNHLVAPLVEAGADVNELSPFVVQQAVEKAKLDKTVMAFKTSDPAPSGAYSFLTDFTGDVELPALLLSPAPPSGNPFNP